MSTNHSRRQFTSAAALAMLAGVTVTITGCGGGGSAAGPSGTDGGTPSGDASGTISANHGHVARVTAAQLSAAGALTLDIQGSAPHTHTVELSSADLTAIAGGASVSRETTANDGHQHTVTFARQRTSDGTGY